MSSDSDCPASSDLVALLRGKLAADAEGALTAHLDRCAACRERLEGLAGGEDFSADVARQLGGEDGSPAGAEPPQPLAEVMEQFAQGPRVNESRSASRPPLEATPTPGWPADFPQPPAQLDRYQLIREIGRGGMGVVYSARDVTLDRQVAIKVLGPQWASDAVARQRFFSEARAAAAVNSRHVVTLHAVEDRGTWPYLVMEYVPGRNLQQLLDEYGPLPLPAILQIGTRVASGLAAAHQKGLVHRDIKPANVLVVVSSGQVKLTDFGLARAATDARITKAGLIVGTLAYMAPEQLDGHAVDHRADLYALGCLYYAMCTGRAPVEGDHTIALLRRVLERRFTPLAIAAPHLPQWLVSIVERLMAVKPEDRIGSAAEVVELLRRQQLTSHAAAEQSTRSHARATIVDVAAPGTTTGSDVVEAPPVDPAPRPNGTWPVPPPAPTLLPLLPPVRTWSPESPQPALIPLDTQAYAADDHGTLPEASRDDRSPPPPSTLGLPNVARPSSRPSPPRNVIALVGALVGLSFIVLAGAALVVRALFDEPESVAETTTTPTSSDPLATESSKSAPFVAPTLPPFVPSSLDGGRKEDSAAAALMRDGKFIEVQLAGRGSQRYASLMEAVDRAPQGAEVILHGDHVWESPPLEIRNRALSIRAAPSTQARIRFVHDATFSGAMLQTDSPLTLERLTLIDDVSGESSEGLGGGRPVPRRIADGVVSTFGSELRMSGCRVGTASRAPCVWVDSATRVELRQCQFSAPAGAGVTWRDIQQRGGGQRAVLIEDCMVRARVATYLDLRHDSNCQVTLMRVVCLADDGVHVDLPSANGPAASSPTILLEAQQSTFDCKHLVSFWTHAQNDGPQMKARAARDLPRYVAWRGQDNLFPPSLAFLALRPHMRLESFEPPLGGRALVIDDLTEWRQLWPSADANIRIEEPRYGSRGWTKSQLLANDRAVGPTNSADDFERRVGLWPADEWRVQRP